MVDASIDSSKQVDLRSNLILGKKTKKPYEDNDEEHKIITLDSDLVVKLLSNNKGLFVDFRKYYKGYPTKRGIRVYASKFKKVADLLSSDIDNLLPNKTV